MRDRLVTQSLECDEGKLVLYLALPVISELQFWSFFTNLQNFFLFSFLALFLLSPTSIIATIRLVKTGLPKSVKIVANKAHLGVARSSFLASQQAAILQKGIATFGGIKTIESHAYTNYKTKTNTKSCKN